MNAGKHYKAIFLLLIVFSMLATGRDASANISGSITYGNGLYASGDNWVDPSTTVSWNVFQRIDGNYQYDYLFSLPSIAKNISHVIIQTSGTFAAADMLSGTTPGGLIGSWDGQGNSNPGIPSALYGIKWDMTGSVTSFGWTIVTGRAPMMGNFYAKDGNANGGVYAYSGTVGSFGSNVVVPDTTPVPLPGAFWLFGSGLAGLMSAKRKIVR